MLPPTFGRLLAACAIVLAVSCGGDDGGGGDTPNGSDILWFSQSGTGTTTGDGGAADLLWVDPNSGLGAPPPPPDPQDIRTYTRPDIYILGNKHPLLTEITTNQLPDIITEENRATYLLNNFRYNEFVRLMGLPVPGNARLLEQGTVRQCARAHAKHYAVWHPNVAFPLINAEGDSVWYQAPAAGAGIEVAPTATRLIKAGAAAGRLPKCKLTVELAGQLIASGRNFRTGDDAANYWITTFPEFLRLTEWTHLGVGFWRGGGQFYYWNAVFARNPKQQFTQPTTPFPLF